MEEQQKVNTKKQFMADSNRVICPGHMFQFAHNFANAPRDEHPADKSARINLSYTKA
jgi:hypothetical protein